MGGGESTCTSIRPKTYMLPYQVQDLINRKDTITDCRRLFHQDGTVDQCHRSMVTRTWTLIHRDNQHIWTTSIRVFVLLEAEEYSP